jgi:SNF2 family DNA or RNA helicase
MGFSAPSATASRSTTIGSLPWAPLSRPWKPDAGQKKGAKFLIEHACAGLFADPGVGKTSITYAAFSFLKKRGVASKMLVIAPLRPAYSVWPGEVEKWTDFHGLRVVLLHGPQKEARLASDADVYVINPEGLDWLLGAVEIIDPAGRKKIVADLKRFKSFHFDTLAIDELSKFKNTNSGRFKSLKQVVGLFARRWGLTGSPAPNGLIDLFGEVYMLDMGRTFGPYITHYRTKYFNPDFSGFSWTIKDGAEKLIYERLKPLVCRLAAEDYFDMPEMIARYHTFDLPEDVRAVYDTLEEDMIASIGKGKVITAANAGAASMKCRQVSSGGIYTTDALEARLARAGLVPSTKREWENLHDGKTDVLEDLIESLQGSPLLVAYDFQHDLDRIKRRFGRDVPYIGGGVSPKRALEIEREWNAGNLPVLFGHPQSMGHGLNLQDAGNHVAWYSLTYDYDTYDQFNRRVRRRGNTNQHVFVHHIIAKNTFDQIMVWALGHKEKTQNALLTAMEDMRKSRR